MRNGRRATVDIAIVNNSTDNRTLQVIQQLSACHYLRGRSVATPYMHTHLTSRAWSTSGEETMVIEVIFKGILDAVKRGGASRRALNGTILLETVSKGYWVNS